MIATIGYTGNKTGGNECKNRKRVEKSTHTKRRRKLNTTTTSCSGSSQKTTTSNNFATDVATTNK
jgi:hypothetical protein